MIQSPRSSFRIDLARFGARGALAVALIAALGLAGCGRKAGLDTPPMAAAGDLQASGQAGPAPDGKPVSPPAEKRKSVLDWLIN